VGLARRGGAEAGGEGRRWREMAGAGEGWGRGRLSPASGAGLAFLGGLPAARGAEPKRWGRTISSRSVPCLESEGFLCGGELLSLRGLLAWFVLALS